MYTTEFGNIYFDTEEEARDYVLKKAHYSIKEIAEELFYHIDVERLLIWCLQNQDFCKYYQHSIAKAKEELADHYIWETVDEEEEE